MLSRRNRWAAYPHAILWLPVITTLCLFGCRDVSSIQISEVANSAYCSGLQSPLTQIDFDTLLKVRGTRVVGEAQSGSELNYEGLFIAVYNGPHDTPGYALAYLRADESDTGINIYYRQSVPPQDAQLPELGTTPCSVFELFDYTTHKPVRVYVNEQLLGEIQPQSPPLPQTEVAH